MKKNILSALILSCFVSVAFSAEPEALTDLSKAQVVQSNQNTLTLKLAANATTGYQWFLAKVDRKLLTPVSQHYEVPAHKNGLVGAPGVSVWTFDVKHKNVTVPTYTTITMVYARSWDVGSEEKKVVHVVLGP